MLGISLLVLDQRCRLENGQMVTTNAFLEIQEHEDDTREEESARQKEFLEKVVISQKGQLRQLEKVGRLIDSTDPCVCECPGAEVEQCKDAAGQQSAAEGD